MRPSLKILAICTITILGLTGCNVRKKAEDQAFLSCMRQADETYPQRSFGPAAALHRKAAGLCFKGQQACKRGIGTPDCERFRHRYLIPR